MKRKKITLYILIICFTSLLPSQTIWTETFSNGCASGCLATTYGGWTETPTGANALNSNKWFVSGAECGNSVGTCGTTCGGSDPSLHIGADDGFMYDPGAAYDAGGLCGFGICVTTNRRIESPVVNCTGYSNIVLKFNFIHHGEPGQDECSVMYFDGTTWTSLGVLPLTIGVCSPQGYWTEYSTDLPSSANNNPNVRIGFNWKNNDDAQGTDPSVAIDDIVLFVKPQACYRSGFAAYTGAGCTANCNLSEFAGLTAMCTGASSGCGSCPDPGPTMSQIFNIPSGCTATLTAAFQRRCNGIGCSVCSTTCNTMSSSNGCCNSGMDVNGNDYLKVGGSLAPVSTTTINLSSGYTSTCGSGAATTAFSTSGNTITATGTNNGGAIIEYVQTGGQLFVEGRSNRQDEIITYTLAIQSGCQCSDVVLPVDILHFGANIVHNVVELQWLTKSEKHLSHYRLEKSIDGVHFEWLANIPSTNSEIDKIYSFIDDNPYEGISYYKLIAVNVDGIDEKYILRDVLYQLNYQPISYSITEDEIKFLFSSVNDKAFFKLYDMSGKLVYELPKIDKIEYVVNRNEWEKGVYVGLLFDGKKYVSCKVVLY